MAYRFHAGAPAAASQMLHATARILCRACGGANETVLVEDDFVAFVDAGLDRDLNAV